MDAPVSVLTRTPPSNQNDDLLVVQLTDLHLPANKGEAVLDVDADETLGEVLRSLPVLLKRPPDFVLATGDIADTGSADAYRRFLHYFDGQRMFTVPGNHDHRENFYALCKGLTPRWVDTPAWRVVLLDSMVDGQDEGRLGEQQLQNLHEALSTSDQNALIVLHHHPKPVHSPWLDKVMLQDADRFFDCIDQYPHVRAVICGHVHQDNVAHHGPTRIPVMAAPSTVQQFAPFTQDYQLDTLAPGYRWLELRADGSFETGVRYLHG